jgi:hypothetical protein
MDNCSSSAREGHQDYQWIFPIARIFSYSAPLVAGLDLDNHILRNGAPPSKLYQFSLIQQIREYIPKGVDG